MKAPVNASLDSCHPIDRSTQVPFYRQIKDSLKDKIVSGVWPAGTRLPSEADVCRAFCVSRVTVRQALSDLATEGLVKRERGRGTYVAEPKIRERLVGRLTGFYEDMVAQGLQPRTRVLSQSVIEAPPALAETLGVAPGAPVIRIERLRTIGREPMLRSVTCIPKYLCPDLVGTREEIERESLYALLERKYGLRIARGIRTIEAIAASENDARLLGTTKGAPLALVRSTSYLDDGRPIEHYEAKHRGDRSRFEVVVVRTPHGVVPPPLGGQVGGRGNGRDVGTETTGVGGENG